jgi:putative flippase GtrA
MPEKWTRAVRYSLVSVVSIVISQAVLVLAFGFAHLPARTSNVLACVVATGPSYYLNRSWAWGRRGKSNLWREVVPFWALAFLGLAFSTWATDAASAFARQSNVSHAVATTIVAFAALAAFGTLWIGKFVVFNAVLFGERPGKRRPTSTLPTNEPLRVPHA